MIKYKIIEVHEGQHSIVVRYYTDKVSEKHLSVQEDEHGKVLRGRTDFNIDLPHPAPQGADLKKLILAHAPVKWLELQELVLDPDTDTSLAELKAKIGFEIEAEIPAPAGQVIALESVTV
jgi:hypothetical protein